MSGPSGTRPQGGRPPLYVRRPVVAGMVRQAPLLAVLVTVGIGLLEVAVDHWRRGLVVIGVALVAGAALRLFLPVRRVGFLAVRSRPMDVVLLTGTGLALVIVALSIAG